MSDEADRAKLLKDTAQHDEKAVATKLQNLFDSENSNDQTSLESNEENMEVNYNEQTTIIKRTPLNATQGNDQTNTIAVQDQGHPQAQEQQLERKSRELISGISAFIDERPKTSSSCDLLKNYKQKNKDVIFAGRYVTKVTKALPLTVTKRFIKPQMFGDYKMPTNPDNILRKIFGVYELKNCVLLITPPSNTPTASKKFNMHGYTIEDRRHLGVTSVTKTERDLITQEQRPENYKLIFCSAAIELRDAFMNTPIRELIFKVLRNKSRTVTSTQYRGNMLNIQYGRLDFEQIADNFNNLRSSNQPRIRCHVNGLQQQKTDYVPKLNVKQAQSHTMYYSIHSFSDCFHCKEKVNVTKKQEMKRTAIPDTKWQYGSNSRTLDRSPRDLKKRMVEHPHTNRNNAEPPKKRNTSQALMKSNSPSKHLRDLYVRNELRSPKDLNALTVPKHQNTLKHKVLGIGLQSPNDLNNARNRNISQPPSKKNGLEHPRKQNTSQNPTKRNGSEPPKFLYSTKVQKHGNDLERPKNPNVSMVPAKRIGLNLSNDHNPTMTPKKQNASQVPKTRNIWQPAVNYNQLTVFSKRSDSVAPSPRTPQPRKKRSLTQPPEGKGNKKKEQPQTYTKLDEEPALFFDDSHKMMKRKSAQFDQLVNTLVDTLEYSKETREIYETVLNAPGDMKTFFNIAQLINKVNSSLMPQKEHLVSIFRIFDMLNCKLYVREECYLPGCAPTEMHRYRIESYLTENMEDFFVSLSIPSIQLETFLNLIPGLVPNVHYIDDAFDLTRLYPSIVTFIRSKFRKSVSSVLAEVCHSFVKPVTPLKEITSPYMNNNDNSRLSLALKKFM